MLRCAGWICLVVMIAAAGCEPAQPPVAQPPAEQSPAVEKPQPDMEVKKDDGHTTEVEATTSGVEKTAEEKVAANPNDLEAWSEVAQERFGAIQKAEPKEALAGIESFQAFMKKHPATDPEVQAQLDRVDGFMEELRLQVETVSRTMPELAAELTSNPEDLKALARYALRLRMDAGPIMYAEPDKAAELIATAKAVIEEAQSKASDPYQLKYATALVGLRNQEEEVAKSRKLISMQGEPAAPLAVDGWANGSPLTDADLQGKVVLLDFWAIWCPGCIEGFPHLRELHDKYADKGLVIIGVTQYFNYKWDPERNAPVQVDPEEEEIPHAEEREVVERFVKNHELKHRIAFDDQAQMTRFYLANGLPHLVLIDRQGKIVISRPGGGEELDARLKELLEP